MGALGAVGGYEGASLITGTLGSLLNFGQTEGLIARDEEKYKQALALLQADQGQLVPRSRQLISDVTGGFRNLRTRAMSLIDQTGRQERKRIAGAFAAQRRAAQASLAGRGLTASTLQAGVGAKFTAAQRNALGEMEQRYLNQRLGTDIQTTGAMLGAQSNLGLQNLAFENALTGQVAGTMLGHNEIQQANPFMDISNVLLATRPAPQPEQPSELGSILGGVGGIASGIGMIGMGFSDRNMKVPYPPPHMPSDIATKNLGDTFEEVDHQEILSLVMELPVSKWSYKADPDTVHIGPMAQDWKQKFEVGGSDKYIEMVDAVGVLLSAVKALATKVHILETRYAAKSIS